MTTDKQREAFEEDYKNWNLSKDKNGDYLCVKTEDAFIDFSSGFQAALQSPEVQKLVDAARLVAKMQDVTEPHEYDALHEALQPFTKG